MKKWLIDIVVTLKLFAIAFILIYITYYFFLFFAYDMNVDFLDIRKCEKINMTWDSLTQKCK